MHRRKFVGSLGAVSLTSIAGCMGGGNGDGSFPTNDPRFVVPYSEGGGSDTYARQISKVMGEVVGESVTVENHEGSGGMVGTRELISSQSGGHDIMTHNLPTIALEYLQQGIDAFDLSDLEGRAIAVYATTPRVTVKNPDLDIDTYEELIERQDEINYGTPGGTELGILQVAEQTHGFEPNNHIQYDGGAPAGQAAASGEIDVASAPEGNFQGMVESGDVEPFFSWSSNGSNLFPDMPTITDESQGGFEPFDWLTETGRALWTNPDASEEAMSWWEDSIEQVMTSDEMQAWSDETGQHIQFSGRDSANQQFSDSLTGVQENLDLDEL